MFGQIWNTLTRKSLPTHGVFGAQLEPIVKYRLAMYLTTTGGRGVTETSITSDAVVRTFGAAGAR